MKSLQSFRSISPQCLTQRFRSAIFALPVELSAALTTGGTSTIISHHTILRSPSSSSNVLLTIKRESSSRSYNNVSREKKTSSRRVDKGKQKSNAEVKTEPIDMNINRDGYGNGETSSKSLSKPNEGDPPPLEAVFMGPFRFALRHFFVPDSIPSSYYTTSSMGTSSDSPSQTQTSNAIGGITSNYSSNTPHSPFERFPPAALAYATPDQLSPSLLRESRGAQGSPSSSNLNYYYINNSSYNASQHNNGGLSDSASGASYQTWLMDISSSFNVRSYASTESTVFSIKTQQRALANSDVALIPIRKLSNSSNEFRITKDSGVYSAEVSEGERERNGHQGDVPLLGKSKNGTVIMRVPTTSIEKKFVTPSFSGRFMGLSSRQKARWVDALDVFISTRSVLSKRKVNGRVQKRTVPTVEDYAACFFCFGRAYECDLHLWRLFCEDYSDVILMNNTLQPLSSESENDIDNHPKKDHYPMDVDLASIHRKVQQLHQMLLETRRYIRFILPSPSNPLGGTLQQSSLSKKDRDLSNVSMEYIIGLRNTKVDTNDNDNDDSVREITDATEKETDLVDSESWKSGEGNDISIVPLQTEDNDNSIPSSSSSSSSVGEDYLTTSSMGSLGKELYDISPEFMALALSGDWLRALTLCDKMTRKIFEKFLTDSERKFFLSKYHILVRKIGLATLKSIAKGGNWETAIQIASTRIPATPQTTPSSGSSSDVSSIDQTGVHNKDMEENNGNDTISIRNGDTQPNTPTNHMTATIPRIIMKKSVVPFTISSSWVAGLMMMAHQRSRDTRIDKPVDMRVTYTMYKSMKCVPEAWKVALRSVSDFLQRQETMSFENKKSHASQLLFKAAATAAACREGRTSTKSPTIRNIKIKNSGSGDYPLSVLETMGDADDGSGTYPSDALNAKATKDMTLKYTMIKLYKKLKQFIYSDNQRKAMHLTLLLCILEQDMTYQPLHRESSFSGGRVLNRLAKTHPKYWSVVIPRIKKAETVGKVFHAPIQLLKALPTSLPVPTINHSVLHYARHQLTENREGVVIVDTNAVNHLELYFNFHKNAIEKLYGSPFGYEMEGIEQEVATAMEGSLADMRAGGDVPRSSDVKHKEKSGFNTAGADIAQRYILKKVGPTQANTRKVIKAKTFKFILPQSTLVEMSSVTKFRGNIKNVVINRSHGSPGSHELSEVEDKHDQCYPSSTSHEQQNTTVSISAKTKQMKLCHFLKTNRADIQAFEPNIDFMCSTFSHIASLHGFETLGAIDRHIGNIALVIDMAQRSTDGSGRHSAGINNDQNGSIYYDFTNNVQPPEDSGIAFGTFYNITSDTSEGSQGANGNEERIVMMTCTSKQKPPARFITSTSATGITSTTLAEKFSLRGVFNDEDEGSLYDASDRDEQISHPCMIPTIMTSYTLYQARRALGICKAQPSNNVVVFTYDKELRSYLEKAGISVYPKDHDYNDSIHNVSLTGTDIVNISDIDDSVID